MELGPVLRRLARLSALAAISGLLFTQVPAAQSPSDAGGRRAVVQMDRFTFEEQLKAWGHRTRGGVGREKSDSSDTRLRSLPHFSSSFTIGATRYPYTMLGYPPPSGRTVQLRSVVVPLRMEFVGFGPHGDISIDFDPTNAVNNIRHSPIFQDAVFPNGVGQFGDMLQRATFWNKMDPARRWHVKMARPRVTRQIFIEVTPEFGNLFSIGTHMFGNVFLDALGSQMRTIVQLTEIEPDEVPIFVTQDVTAEALGFHDAFSTFNDDDSETLQTLIYTSWLDPAFVSDLFADISTLNHEVGEWLNDPFINNVVPLWRYPPPPPDPCGNNPFLEVGDPQGNGPNFSSFPVVPITLDGVTYHLQDLVMLPWFAHEVPSSAEHGWYDFPATTQITAPARFCP